MTEQSIDIILTEMRDLRTRMDERFDSQDTEITTQGKQITALAVQMKDLAGNGKPGRVERLEKDVANLKRYKTVMVTYFTAITTGATALLYRGHELMSWLSKLGR